MPRCSWSISINLISYSLSRSIALLSKTRLRLSGASSALTVMMSSAWAARSTLVSEARLMPSARFRSQRYGAKLSALSIIDTSATCELSMACSAMPESLQSKLHSWTRSLMASTIYETSPVNNRPPFHRPRCRHRRRRHLTTRERERDRECVREMTFDHTFLRRAAWSRRASNIVIGTRGVDSCWCEYGCGCG